MRNVKHLILDFNTSQLDLPDTSKLNINDIVCKSTLKKIKTNYVFSPININFLKKERLYTKLKYSRSPAYDIVSGGSAALLSAFIGFLVAEKFGFELVDSGDFYYLFMYLVFISFSLRPLLFSTDKRESLFENFSKLFGLANIINFYLSLFIILVGYFKKA